MILHRAVAHSHTQPAGSAGPQRRPRSRVGALARTDRQRVRALLHETRNHLSLLPVAAWKLRCEAATQAPGLVPHAVRMERAAQACQILVQDLMATLDGGTPTLQFELVEIDALVVDLLATLSPYFEQRRVRLRRSVHALGCPVIADAQAIQRVLLNLIYNAFEAMPEGGELRVSVRPTSSRWVTITVEDTGSGMPSERLARVGRLGYSTKSNGLGIGLWLAFRTLHAHRGRLSIESHPGRGTRCTIRLPAANGVARRQEGTMFSGSRTC